MIKPKPTSPFPPHQHDHEHCVTEAMQNADTVCREQGRKLTRQRRQVLELVWSSHQPVGAYDILERMATAGKRPAPPTVYRALDFLIEAGLVHRLDTLNAYIGCADPRHAHEGQFLICTQCRSVAELDDRDIEAVVESKARQAGFTPQSLVLEIQGHCDVCHAKSGS